MILNHNHIIKRFVKETQQRKIFKAVKKRLQPFLNNDRYNENIIKQHLDDLRIKFADGSTFAFLQEDLLLTDKIQELVKKWSKECNRNVMPKEIDNAIYTSQGILYLTESEWDILYRLNHTPNIDIEHLLQGEKEKIEQPTILLEKMKIIQDSITNLAKINPKSSYYKIAKTFAANPGYASYLTTTLKYYLTININRNKENNIKIITTDIAKFIGTNLILMLICNDNFFNKVHNMLKDNQFIKKRVSDKFGKYINAVLCGNKEYYLDYFQNMKKHFHKMDNKTFDTLVSIVNHYHIYLIWDLYLHKNNKDKFLEQMQIKELFYNNKDHYSAKMANMHKTLIQSLIQQGNIVINECIKEQLFMPIKNEKISQKMQKLKTIATFELSSDLRDELLKERNNKPFLCKSNKKIYEKSLPFNIQAAIHNNNNTQMRINKQSYLHKEKNNFLGTKYKIDIPYLIYMLNIVDRVQSIHLNTKTKSVLPLLEEAKQYLSIIYTWYNIKENIFNALLEYKNITIKKLALRIRNYLIDFNSVDYQEIQKSIDSYITKLTKKEYAKYNSALMNLQKIFDKAKNIKYYIKGLFKDAVLYSQFKYFIHDGFLDSRARYYINGIFTNIQTFPLAKTIVKPYGNHLLKIKEHLNIITEGIKKNLCNRILHQELNAQKRTFVRNNEILYVDYLYRYLDAKKISKDVFRSWFFNKKRRKDDINHLDSFKWLYNNIKKVKETAIIHSFIYQRYYNNPIPNLEEYYELDARSSGLQMIALLLRSKKLGQITNLIESVDEPAGIVEIYSIANDNFIIMLTTLQQFVTEFMTICLNKGLIQDMQPIIPVVDSDKLLTNNLVVNFMKISMKSLQIQQLLDELVCVFNNTEELKNKINNSRDNFNWLQKYMLKRERANGGPISITSNISSYLINVKIANTILEISKMNGWDTRDFLENRERFKHAIMTVVYNSTSYGRRTHFQTELQKTNKTLNIIPATHISIYCIFLENYFYEVFVPKYLQEFKLMKKISKIIADKDKSKSVTWRNKHVTIKFNPRITKKTRVHSAYYSLDGKRKITTRFQITIPTESLDKKQIEVAFMANFIQSMDAFIMHHIKNLFFNLNQYLLKHNVDLEINDGANHDTFWTVLKPYLRIIIKDAYINLYHINYLEGLHLSRKTHALITQLINKEIPLHQRITNGEIHNINPNFVK